MITTTASNCGYTAAANASQEFALGSVGAGTGATTVNLKGGIGSASAVTADGFTVGAIAATNAAGSVVVGEGPWFWAAPYEQAGEFGGLGFPLPIPPEALHPRTKGAFRVSTALIAVATDASLTKSQVKRLAVMAQDGLSRAGYPVHTPLDGDVVFAAATGAKPLVEPTFAFMRLGAMAANAVGFTVSGISTEVVGLIIIPAEAASRAKVGVAARSRGRAAGMRANSHRAVRQTSRGCRRTLGSPGGSGGAAFAFPVPHVLSFGGFGLRPCAIATIGEILEVDPVALSDPPEISQSALV